MIRRTTILAALGLTAGALLTVTAGLALIVADHQRAHRRLTRTSARALHGITK